MDTTVYLIRHSEKLGTKYMDKCYSDEFYQVTKEKRVLSSEGERKAKKNNITMKILKIMMVKVEKK